MEREENFEIKTPKYSNLFYRKENIAYTHSGVFHADDVCSAALLQIVFPGIVIKRVSKVPEDAELAFDIGFGKYDHHQHNAELRPDGNKYASFGLLWRDLGTFLFPCDTVRLFDEVFVKGIDYTDNTGTPNPFSATIKSFNPAWDSEENLDTKFFEAVDFAKIAILNQFERFRSSIRSDKEILKRINDPKFRPTNNSLLLDIYMPYQKMIVNTEIAFVIYPSNRNVGEWNVNTVPTESGGNIAKIPLPLEWFDNPPSGMTFMHDGRFIASFDKKENAINAIKSIH